MIEFRRPLFCVFNELWNHVTEPWLLLSTEVAGGLRLSRHGGPEPARCDDPAGPCDRCLRDGPGSYTHLPPPPQS